MKTNEIVTYFKNTQQKGDGEYMACCPAHDDQNPSLSIRYNKERNNTSIKCFAGCETKDILDKIGLRISDLYEDNYKKKLSKETVYNYFDEKANIVYRRIRKEYADGTKTFLPVQPDGTKNLKGVRRVIYNLPAVLNASTIYFVEGEKCADIINQSDYVATTLDSGSNSRWFPHFSEWLQGKEIIIIPDNDEAGLKYAKNILDNLPNAKVVKLPDIQEKEDVYDWLMSGHCMEEIPKLPLFDLSRQQKKQQEEHAGKTSNQKETQSETLIRLVEENGAIVFHDTSKNCYVSLAIDGHRELLEINSNNFQLWANGLYFKQTGVPIKTVNLTSVIEILSSKALFDNKEDFSLYERVAKNEDAFWYDLTNNDWQAVTITTDGWKINDNPPILFRRYRHQNPQSNPRTNGNISKLLKYINIKQRKTLFLCWVVSCFIPGIPHAMPVFYGEKGAAKTTACELLKKLIDPSALDTLSLPNSSRDLTIMLKQHWFLPFDNVSHISEEKSDILCRAITGGGIQERRLYTNSEDYIYTFQKCIAINGINNIVERADLLDRAILIELSRIKEEERQELSKVLSNFEEDLPEILGGVFDVLSKAMAIYPTVKLDKLPRMADFARWCYAIAEAMGENGQVFIDEYTLNQEYQNTELLNSNMVAILILKFMENTPEWSGKVSDLYNILASSAENMGINRKSKDFPSQPNGLSRCLNNLKSNLEWTGITYMKEAKSDGNYIFLKNQKTSPLPPYIQIPRENKALPKYEFTSTDTAYENEDDEEQIVDF